MSMEVCINSSSQTQNNGDVLPTDIRFENNLKKLGYQGPRISKAVVGNTSHLRTRTLHYMIQDMEISFTEGIPNTLMGEQRG